MVKRSIPVRLARRAVIELKKVVGSPARKFQRVALRQWNSRVADRRRVTDGSQFASHGYSFEVISLSSLQARERATSTNAEFLVLTREPDTLLQSAVSFIGAAVERSDSRMWFGDSRNQRGVPAHRSKFNRLLLRQVDALGPIIVLRSSALDAVGLHEVSPALWPLRFALTLDEDEIELIPTVLGIGDATVSDLGGRESDAVGLVKAELQRSGIVASVEPTAWARRLINYEIDGAPQVSIIIPTRGTTHDGEVFVVEAVRSIIAKSTYANYEVVIVADDPTPQSVVDEIDGLAGQDVRWVRWSEPFNFSSKMNLGVACASGEYVLFLNDDVEVVAPQWIENMLSLIGVDQIAYSGALLFFDDQTIQHAGHIHDKGAGHVAIGESFNPTSVNDMNSFDQIRSGVTAACSIIAVELFEQLGGFSKDFPGNYNDVDFSLKVTEAGFKNAVSSRARLYHFESKTRDAAVSQLEIDMLFGRWSSRIQSDLHSRTAK